MSFVSINFFVFLILTSCVYFVFPIKYRWTILLIASTYFYLPNFPSGLGLFGLVLLSTLVAFVGGIMIEKTEADNRKKRRMIVSCAASILIGYLIFVKAVSLAGLSFSKYIIPLGISYYTFSLVGYLADIYWKKDAAEHNYFKLLLFVSFFPKILQGPISKHSNLGKQLVEGHRFNYENMCFGVQLMLWGFFKKLVIADRAALFVGKVFNEPSQYGGSIILTATVLSAIQLYCDFSGYVDIASGICQVWGIELEKNFDRPFFSKSGAEFWRRWHISLGTWFKDYVYLPIVLSPRFIKIRGKIKKKRGPRMAKIFMAVAPAFIVWILTGLWHGTGLPYLVWGMYWFSIISFSTVFEPEIKKFNKLLHINTEAPTWKVFQMVRTLLIFSFARLITVPNSLTQSARCVKRIILNFNPNELLNGTLLNARLNLPNWIVLFAAMLILLVVGNVQNKVSVRKSVAGWNLVFRWAFYCVAFWLVMIFGIYGAKYNAAAFMYMNY